LKAEDRRNALINLLRNSCRPLTGAVLADYFKVSRQVIVQDIAILRASGEQISGSIQGYVVPSAENDRVQAVIACSHTREQIREELCAIVDFGGKVLDVIVEHPVYGELCANLMVASRYDVNLFLEALDEAEASPLLALTGGIHLHTLEAPDQAVLQEIIKKLDELGYLVK